MTSSRILEIDLARFSAPYPRDQRHELRDQNARAAGIWHRLQDDDIPGVILGDEVGKGKTYVALALAFATLSSKKRARILVLTHSRSMAGIWAARWHTEVREMVHPRWRARFDTDWKPLVLSQYADFVETLNSTVDASAILFASYDTLKRFHSSEGRRRRLLAALRLIYRTHHLRLSQAERLRLVKEMIPDGGTMPRRVWHVNEQAAKLMLKTAFDPDTRSWHRNSHRVVQSFLDTEAGRELSIHPKLDLLIVDEAHKLEGERRGAVVTHLLSRKFAKGLWVTATPFALSVSELRRRLAQFENAAGARRSYVSEIKELPLDDYRLAISSRVEFERLPQLQTGLRKRLVRSTWNTRKDRRILDWTAEADGAALLPSMALERVITNILSGGDRTHIASVRETLCSSWAATLKSGALERFRDDPWVDRLRALLAETVSLDPKLCAVVSNLVELAQRGEKTVVFTHRTETSAALARALDLHPVIGALTLRFQKASRLWRQRADLIKRELNVPEMGQAYAIAKIMAFSLDAPIDRNPRSLKSWWNRHRESLDAQRRSADVGSIFEFLESVAGKARRLPVVARFDSQVSGDDDRGDYEAVSNARKFNLPCAPLILIASRKGQEGIDLHHYCRRVVLYDLPWNPALIEQRIGRVHRLGGMRSRKQPVEVVFCYQRGSYEELIAQRIKQRCEMMHTLLGAGTWLDQDRQVEDLERYRMTFPP